MNASQAVTQLTDAGINVNALLNELIGTPALAEWINQVLADAGVQLSSPCITLNA